MLFVNLTTRVPVLCSIWDDVRTYLTSSIDPKEKAFLKIAFAHFKKKEEVKS